MYRSYKFRIYPNEEQIKIIDKTLGCKRFVYNYYLTKITKYGYKTAKENIQDYKTNLKYEYPFLQEIEENIIIKTLFSLDDNIKINMKKYKSYPPYKKKNNKNIYIIPISYENKRNLKTCNISIDLAKRKIRIPGLNYIQIRGYRNLKEINSKLITITIIKEINSKYYISILCEVSKPPPQKNIPRTIVGIDLGIKKLLTLSDGTTFENNKYIYKYEARIKRKQRELSKKEKGSNNYKKCRKELANLYIKLRSSRDYYLHQITKKITDEYDVIVCETLTTQKMIIKGKENNLSKNLTDASFNKIIEQLKHKSEQKGKIFITIIKYYPSSQLCSKCLYKNEKYKDIKYRIYKCPKCGLKIDRDLNASFNIMYEGLKEYMKMLV